MKVWEWIKQNKLTTILLIILFFFLVQNWFFPYLGKQIYDIQPGIFGIPQYQKEFGGIGGGGPTFREIIPPPDSSYPPAPEVKDRLTIQTAYFSLLVKNVREVASKIADYAKNNDGYMVSSNFDNPGESPSGNITIRIPAKNLSSTLDFLRELALRVVSENLTGEDVTDQYVDIEARLATLNKTKAKFEEILDKAIEIQDILNVQREIINLQSQIDSLKGQRQYLEKSAQMAKITIYLSTDEISLPYAPSETWRPNVIFKLAARSLIGNLRSLGTVLIWTLVYSVIWAPVLLLAYFVKRRRKS